MLELIMGINSLQGIFKAEQFSACVCNTWSTQKAQINFSVQTRATPTPTCSPHEHPQPCYSSSAEEVWLHFQMSSAAGVFPCWRTCSAVTLLFCSLQLKSLKEVVFFSGGIKHKITWWRHFAFLQFVWITWLCPGKLPSSFFGIKFFLQFERVEMKTCCTVPSVLHSVNILLNLKLFRTGDSATSKGNSVKLKGKHSLNINVYQRKCNKFQGMHSLLISFAANIHRQDILKQSFGRWC